MAMNFEELDATTRSHMVVEFDGEQASNPYRSKALTPLGRSLVAGFVRAAIQSGTEVDLIANLKRDDIWEPMEEYELKGVVRQRRRNIAQAAERLGLTEFNTWYVRGFAKRLLDEQVSQCQVYRAAEPKWEPADCSTHEGIIIAVAEVYAGHRARYWPEPGDPTKLSVPFSPNCHHTIRRLKGD
jgi:hypothetical protein